MAGVTSAAPAFDEVAFVRLLAACERNVFGISAHDEVDFTSKRPAMRQFDAGYLPNLTEFLRVLSEGMEVLERRHGSHEAASVIPTLHKSRAEQLMAFRLRIGHLYEAKRLRASELEAVTRAEQERARAEAANSDLIKRTVSAPARRPRKDDVPTAPPPLTRNRTASGRGGALDAVPETKRGRAGSATVSAAATPASAPASPVIPPAPSPLDVPSDELPAVDAVELERRIHANMEKRLAQLSGLLKEKATKVLDDLRADNQALDATSAQLDRNLSKVQSANKQLDDSRAASWSSCWTTAAMIAAMLLMFMLTFLLIQLKGKPRLA